MSVFGKLNLSSSAYSLLRYIFGERNLPGLRMQLCAYGEFPFQKVEISVVESLHLLFLFLLVSDSRLYVIFDLFTYNHVKLT